MAVTASERKPWHAIFRLLERDERVFAVLLAVIAGGLCAASAALVPPWVGWTPPVMLAALFGLPAVTLGLVADRERRARGEVERLNVELTGTLSRLQTAQQELLVAERMATVG